MASDSFLLLHLTCTLTVQLFACYKSYASKTLSASHKACLGCLFCVALVCVCVVSFTDFCSDVGLFVAQVRSQESVKVTQLDIAVPMHLRGMAKKHCEPSCGMWCWAEVLR